MRLVGIALRDESPRHEGRGGVKRRGRRQRLKALEQLVGAGVGPQRLEVADRQCRAALRCPLPVTEGDYAVARERFREMLGRAEHRTSERMVTEYRLVDQMLGQGRRLIVVAADLLYDDTTLLVEFRRVKGRPADEIRQQVSRLDALG